MNATHGKTDTGGSMAKWVALHLVGSIIAVLGALYLIADMALLDGIPSSTAQAIAMVAIGLVLDFWGVVELRRIQLRRKAAKEEAS
ncbi:hypothetical protein [Denitromonas iodatirespirans]|uniref:Uncharacterized protein n=1 Tax=Denitromonas iodatirespirans TaxID=2795389 RepID=A0A944DNW5_DENI1|nr:hypothetical protein [Denitromonas iodatirespirans]MBT0962014.1 hypothetical protein [Denitromonas iodatirespirans]